MQSRGVVNESASDDRTDRVAGRWHFDPRGAATAELYRRDLSNHYRSVGIARRRRLSSEIVQAPFRGADRIASLSPPGEKLAQLVGIGRAKKGAASVDNRASGPMLNPSNSHSGRGCS